MMSWRNLCLVLTAVCVFQTWRGCHRPEAPGSLSRAQIERCESVLKASPSWDTDHPAGLATNDVDHDETEPPAGTGVGVAGFQVQVPSWALWLAPQPGENMLAYRDRIVPIAQAAIAPHRARVARGRDDFARAAHLDNQQRAALDTATQEAATAIQDKVLGAFLAGDFSPATFKPMTGITLARDVLDTIDQANRKFMASLREDQRAALAQHPFDFADYLLFSTHWEEALGFTN